MRRVFLIKLVNVLLILCTICVYQSHAMQRKEKVDSYREKLAVYEQEKNAFKNPYRDGVYEGSGEGFGGKIKVQVTVKAHRIKDVSILSAQKETPEYLKAAKKLLTDVVSAQSADVDAVAGATLSSGGILLGVKEALEQAKRK